MGPTAPSLAAQYPGDVGIESDARVIFVEKFDGALGGLIAKWGDGVLNTSTIVTDVPAGFPGGSHSLQIPRLVGDNGGQLFHTFTGQEQVYCRYYVKHDTAGPPAHSGCWMGGDDPVSSWPVPGAGTQPGGGGSAGSPSHFSAACEQTTYGRFDHYDYWHDMHPDAGGGYWGNYLINNPAIDLKVNQWNCVEHFCKLNNPRTGFTGEHAIWLDGTKISHLGLNFPHGSWVGGIFTQNPGDSGTFEGFKWSYITALDLNWVWMQSWVDATDPSLVTTSWFSNIIVATSYIGPIA